MLFGTAAPPPIMADLGEYRRWLSYAEQAGFDLLTCGDSQSLWPECFTASTLAAVTTSRPALAVVVSNPVTRHPAVAASAAATIQQISDGRFRYGLASGDSALRNIGLAPASVADLEAYVTAVQGLTRGAAVTWGENEMVLRWLAGPRAQPPHPVPVWLAAEGPRTQVLAGRVADGVILTNCLTAERYADACQNIDTGLRQAGRTRDQIEIWCMASLIFAPTRAAGIDQALPVLAGTANHAFRFTLDGKAVPEEMRAPLLALMAEYDSRQHGGTSNANGALVEKYGLRDFLAGLGTIAGPPQECAERIRGLAGLGIENLLVHQMAGDTVRWLREFSALLPAVS
jgi:5,10-methylenetetrahydromethanopterin reductase